MDINALTAQGIKVKGGSLHLQEQKTVYLHLHSHNSRDSPIATAYSCLTFLSSFPPWRKHGMKSPGRRSMDTTCSVWQWLEGFSLCPELMRKSSECFRHLAFLWRTLLTSLGPRKKCCWHLAWVPSWLMSFSMLYCYFYLCPNIWENFRTNWAFIRISYTFYSCCKMC